MPDNGLVVLKAFATQMEADLAKSALASAGIAAMIQADSVGGMRPHIGWSTGGYRLLVREDDEDNAREILQLDDE
jgi:Putative prokaryotic signal transducing protein